MKKKKQKRNIGDIIESNNFGPYEIISIDRKNPQNPKVTIKFLKTGSIVDSTASKAYYGKVQDWSQPSVLGRGIIFPGASIDYKREYYLWLDMMCRCYRDENFKQKCYDGVEVDVDWWNLKNFIKDLPNIPGYERWKDGEKLHFDKDILSKDKKIYSRDTCQFIEPEKNCLSINSSQAIPVEHIKSGLVFESMGKAAKHFKTHMKNIANHCNNKTEFQEFRYKNPKPKKSKKGRLPPKKVMHIPSGKTYKSLREAARSHKINHSSVASAAKRGITWKFLK